MYQKERLDSIINILKENGYVTVKYLVEKLHYSNATVNRDLNVLEGKKIITRSYGGAELVENTFVPLEFRYDKMKIAKRHIAKCASDLIHNGDTVFIDGSTTSEGMGAFITDKKDITVITNNMALSAYLSEYGIKVICTGGYVTEPPSMLGGDDAVSTAMKYRTDKMFFSTGGVSEDGIIGSNLYRLLLETAMQNSDMCYFLIDHSKINQQGQYILTDFGMVDGVITDYRFPDDTKEKYKNTKFYEV